MERNYLTTSEVATLLSVSADTVLKWVKTGKIQSYRTPGGHCRIPRDAVTTLLPGMTQQQTDVKPSEESFYQYCWEYNEHAAGVKLDCHKCLVYKSRAKRCYELRELQEELGSLQPYCTTSCTECEFYKLASGQGPSVLVVTRNEELTSSLGKQNGQAEFLLKFARSEYECAAAIEDFRPDYVVVDCSLGAGSTKEICRHLANDMRIPFTRIILAAPRKRRQDFCDQEIFGWIRKPFTIDQLKECIRAIN